jgi:hypothetical protein
MVRTDGKTFASQHWDTFKNGAIDAIKKCAPYQLPEPLYEQWKFLELTFSTKPKNQQ